MNTPTPRFFRGDIWRIETNKGVELGLIISNNIGNKSGPIIRVARVTEWNEEKTHKKLPTQAIYYPTKNNGSDKPLLVCFEQQMTYAKERMLIKVETAKRLNLDYYLRLIYIPDALDGEAFPNYHTGIKQFESYHLEVDEVAGSEQNGNRIVYVISNNVLNDAGYVTVVPITAQPKQKMPTHVFLPRKKVGLAKNSNFLAEHARTLSLIEFMRAEKRSDLPKEYHKASLEAVFISTAKTEDVLNKIAKSKKGMRNA